MKTLHWIYTFIGVKYVRSQVYGKNDEIPFDLRNEPHHKDFLNRE